MIAPLRPGSTKSEGRGCSAKALKFQNINNCMLGGICRCLARAIVRLSKV